MANIVKFNKDNLKLLRDSLDKALANVEAEFGVKLDLGKITFLDDSFKTSISAVIASKVGDNPYLAGVPAEYINNLTKYRNYKDALGKEVTDRFQKFVIVGLRGQHFIAKKAGQPDGKMFKLPIVYGDALYNQVNNVQ
jgi:hypothetical protein